ncbi:MULTISPECIES: AEC family transporter [unclassified Paenibacillus]|uniref:AEC family transporter n=1 Tax=unclassified Paenibacillus TaxID=185978 RepID=UPI001AE78644|nr:MULTISPECIES: AEC family transporter [unclassified Paenibacillus]MBP1154995.1 putative permease [Paenibacillus sp. PvP091]MBP1169622.1 putative permease [Paenibacillus sp. PvR098]MBP2440650.1 putative permease [Paenibacillus sp. PvP052]
MLQSIVSTLFQVIVPLSIPVFVGAILGRYRNLETKPLLTLYLYFLSPAIILDTLNDADISLGDVYQTIGFCLLHLILMWALANGLGKILKWHSAEIAGLTLISTLTNSVNYGLPLVLLAFGTLGLEKASIYVIIQMIIVNTIGVYFAARSQFSVNNAIKSVFSLPAIYAALLAIVLRALDLHLPAGIEQGVSLAAAAYSPVVLVILGAQMVSVNNSELEPKAQTAFWTGLVVRLCAAPVIACFVLYVLNIKGTLFSVLFILASMPVAVNAVILAERFNASPKFVSKCILWTTLASFIVLPVLIALVK